MTFATNTSKAYFRDGLVTMGDAQLSIASAPVLYGLSIYTVFAASWNKEKGELYMFRLREHFDRLVNSAQIVDFSSFNGQWNYDKFEKEMRSLLKQNKIKQDVLVRVSVFIDDVLSGTKTYGLPVSLSAFVYPAAEFLPRSGAKLCVSSWLRTPDNSIPARAKVNGSYVNATLMKNEALRNGYDDAIALDEHGHVCESTVANIFIVRGSKLITPASSTHLLEGITRDSIFGLCDSMGTVHEQRSVDRSELYIADEIFLCGSSAMITPVISVDGRSIGNGKPGSITKSLMRTYSDVQHAYIDDFANWRTTV
jgi:branched-chain amino acid aminotransferase